VLLLLDAEDEGDAGRTSTVPVTGTGLIRPGEFPAPADDSRRGIFPGRIGAEDGLLGRSRSTVLDEEKDATDGDGAFDGRVDVGDGLADAEPPARRSSSPFPIPAAGLDGAPDADG
jgi:hypothetical protein